MLSAAVVMLLKPRGLAWAASTAVSLFAFAIAISMTLVTLDGGTLQYFMGGWQAPYGIELRVDALSTDAVGGNWSIERGACGWITQY